MAFRLIHDDPEGPVRLTFLPPQMKGRERGPAVPVDGDGAVADMRSVTDASPYRLLQLEGALAVLLLQPSRFFVLSTLHVSLLLHRRAPPAPIS